MNEPGTGLLSLLLISVGHSTITFDILYTQELF
jgi:hypothetical protein